MALEAAATFAGIHNENEFYSHHYLSEIFAGDVKETIKRWQDDATDRTPHATLRALATDYARFRDAFERRAGPAGGRSTDRPPSPLGPDRRPAPMVPPLPRRAGVRSRLAPGQPAA